MIDEIYNYRESQLPAVKFSNEWDEMSAEFEATLTAEQLKCSGFPICNARLWLMS